MSTGKRTAKITSPKYKAEKEVNGGSRGQPGSGQHTFYALATCNKIVI